MVRPKRSFSIPQQVLDYHNNDNGNGNADSNNNNNTPSIREQSLSAMRVGAQLILDGAFLMS